MEQYISKSALVAEIEKYISNYKGILNKIDKSSDDWVDSTLMLESKIDVLQHILSFLNTLEVKGMDLDYIKKELDEAVRIYKPNGHFGWGTLYNVATYFYELGLKTQKGE